MTLILWLKHKWQYVIYWDKLVSWWHIWKRKDAVKITRLWDTLFWYAWDNLTISFYKECYSLWIKETKLDLYSVNWIKDFVDFVKSKTHITDIDIDLIFINTAIQIIVTSKWFVENMLYTDINNWILVIWSWTPYALSSYYSQWLWDWDDIDINTIFHIANKFSTSCSFEYDTLVL